MKIVSSLVMFLAVLMFSGCSCPEEYDNSFLLQKVRSEAELLTFYFDYHHSGCRIKHFETPTVKWLFVGVRTASGMLRCEVLCFARVGEVWELRAVGAFEGIGDSELSYRLNGPVVEIVEDKSSKVLMKILNR